MNSRALTLLGLSAALTSVLAQEPAPAPPIYPAVPAPSTNPQVYVYDQKPVATSAERSYLISPDQAQSIINRFKDTYKQMGNPRFLIYVNRELIDEKSGLKLSSHKRVVETTRNASSANGAANNAAGAPALSDTGRATEHVSSSNIFRVHDAKEVPLADRQTARDIERLFGRPLRMAGAHLADQRVASQLVDSKGMDNFTLNPESEQARKDREALTKIADVVLEVLVSSHNATVSDASGEQHVPAPDIQVTAIRLSDAQILGQAASGDLIGQGAAAANAARTFGMREITEGTALSLMEDMMLK